MKVAICCEYTSYESSTIACQLGHKEAVSERGDKRLIATRTFVKPNVTSTLSIDTHHSSLCFTNLATHAYTLKDTLDDGFLASTYVDEETLAIALRDTKEKNRANIYVCDLGTDSDDEDEEVNGDACKSNGHIRIDEKEHEYAMGFVVNHKDDNSTENVFVLAEILVSILYFLIAYA